MHKPILGTPICAPQLALAPLGALGPNQRAQAAAPAVVGGEGQVRSRVTEAEVAAVDDQALLAALEADDDFRDGGVGGAGEGGADAAVLRVDAGDGLDVDQASQVQYDVGQVVVGGAEGDRAPQRFLQQGRVGDCPSIDGALGATVGGELHAGADSAGVGLVGGGRAGQGGDRPP